MLTWPLPALIVWALCWALAFGLRAAQAPLWATLLLPAAAGALAALAPPVAATTWRRVFVAGGFPLSVLALGQGTGLPAWWWLAPLALLLLAYPMNAWRDAPVFPTPRGALAELPQHAPLPDDVARAPVLNDTHAAVGAQAGPLTGMPAGRVAAHHPSAILDAGCGMGDALIELRAAYPHARIHGIEWSWLWRFVAALRCPWARVTRGDMWAQSWAGFDLVYLFQRPETMPRAIAKARAEMRPGAWLVSLEFEGRDAQGVALTPHARLSLAGGRPIWVYRIG